MASQLTKTRIGDYTVFYDADITATAHLDVMAGPCRLVAVRAKNTGNAAPAYLKTYDALAPTVGTTAPKEIYALEGSGGPGVGHTSFNASPPDGVLFETGLSFAACNAGGTAGTTNPTGTTTLTLLVKDA